MLERLKLINDKTTLLSFLSENYEEVYDYFSNQPYQVLYKRIKDLQKIIAKYNYFYKQLEPDELLALNFINLLLEVCERYGLVSQFRLLYGVLNNNNYPVSTRTEAASLFFIDVNTIEDYYNRLGKILDKLVYADNFEEDNSDKPTLTLINYYLQVIKHFWQFNPQGVNEIKTTIESYISEANSYSFLKSELLNEVLSYKFDDYNNFSERVQTLLDEYFDREILETYQNYQEEDFLIETGTDYANALLETEANFEAIRQLSFQFREDNSDLAFYSLKRGVAVIENEQQLYSYMIGYGAMHQAKLQDAFQTIDSSILNKISHIVDWGCGQAIGSIVLCDYLQNYGLDFYNKKFILIEPSKLAISRGALHLRKYNNLAKIITINNYLDSIEKENLIINDSINITLHIFSNILDIELFSLTHLTSLVSKAFSGLNIFICVSPYINELKTSRINSFVSHYEKNTNFQIIASKNYKQEEWKNNWTMIQRVFSVEL